MSAWSTLYSHTGSLFVEVMALLLYISPPLNETFKHVRFPICAHGDDCRFTIFLALFTLHQQAEWHQRFREVFQHNSAVTCCKCWMSPSSLCIFSMYCPHSYTYCNLLHLCWLPRSKMYEEKKRHSKYDISLIVWMFYQPVAAGLNYYCCTDSSLSILL